MSDELLPVSPELELQPYLDVIHRQKKQMALAFNVPLCIVAPDHPDIIEDGFRDDGTQRYLLPSGYSYEDDPRTELRRVFRAEAERILLPIVRALQRAIDWRKRP